MKFDTIVIGGGLSGLVSGISCAAAGQRVAIVSAGQSALHFWSGSFDLLGHTPRGRDVIEPLRHIDSLPDGHPYRKIGVENLRRMLGDVPELLAEAGIRVKGSIDKNHYRITPMGYFRAAWLTLDDYVMFPSPAAIPWQKATLVNIRSYLDFYPRFLALGLEAAGVECRLADVDVPQLAPLRASTTEMRATNMARFLRNDAVDSLAREIDKVAANADVVIMPAVLGIFSDEPVKRLRARVKRPVAFVATTPASVPGVRCQLALRDRFQRLGGVFLAGDTVEKGDFDGHRLRRVFTANLGDTELEAENFVISTGSFFGHGLIATIDRIYEPVLGLDLNVEGRRTEWYDKDVYAPQPYMGYGVVTDEMFRPSRRGEIVENLYATGALLAGFNALKEGSGAGITLATALSAARNILK